MTEEKELPIKCPKCQGQMKPVRFGGFEVERCSGCKGLWFDMLEEEHLQKLSGSEAIDTGSPEVGKRMNKERDILCPVCENPMIKMVVNGQPHITYEACTVCYGVYFDAGEFKDFKDQTFVEWVRASVGKPAK